MYLDLKSSKSVIIPSPTLPPSQNLLWGPQTPYRSDQLTRAASCHWPPNQGPGPAVQLARPVALPNRPTRATSRTLPQPPFHVRSGVTIDERQACKRYKTGRSWKYKIHNTKEHLRKVSRRRGEREKGEALGEWKVTYLNRAKMGSPKSGDRMM